MTQGLVLVTGGSGAVGPAVLDALWSSGYAVRTLTRRKPEVRPSQPVDLQVGDITDPESVASAMKGVSAVVHLAGRLHFAGPPSRDIDAYRRVNVQGTANVVTAATAAGAQRVVFASTIAVYGSSLRDPVNESTPPRPDTPYAITKYEAEEIVRRARRDNGEPLGVVLRLAAVYGARLRGNYHSLVRGLARRRFLPIGDGLNRRTVIHDHDVGLAVVHVLQNAEAAGRSYNLTDGAVHTTDEIVAAICGALGRSTPRWHIPSRLAFGGAVVLDDLRRLTGRGAGALRDRLQRYVENVAVDGSAIQRELDFHPKYTLERGWQQVINEMRTRGELA